MKGALPKSSQDVVGKLLSKWRNARVAKEIKPPFLDIACGDNLLVKKMEGGKGVDLVDYGAAALVIKDFAELPFEGGSFKTVAIVASLNYFDHPKRVLLECQRVLCPGGILVLTLLNPLVGRLWHLLREPWAKHPGFSFQQLEGLTAGTNLKITKRARFMLGMNNLYILTKI